MAAASTEHDLDGMDGRSTIELNGKIYVAANSAVADGGLRSRISRYDDDGLRLLRKFKYKPLRSMRRRIRLLRLFGSGAKNPEIRCELFEVEFGEDNKVRPVLDSGLMVRQRGDKGDQSRNGDHAGATSSMGGAEKQSDEIQYEALSWCWGSENKEYGIRIPRGTGARRLKVTRELALALKYLRLPNEDRILWIDALCIDQANHEERNHQVQMMSRIYSSAQQVCVWLGEGDESSRMAIQFIGDIMKLENFDTISEKRENAIKWQSLLRLMQRPWFSRRWVVQEIALARAATIHCGEEQVPWEEFAVAVELFVEVETATHRLSEVMQKDEAFGYVPQWFEHVSELGASVLVQATGKVFRRDSFQARRVNLATTGTARRESRRSSEKKKKLSVASAENASSSTMLGSSQRPLLTLEYLVSSLSVFEATQPRDAIYSLLAIGRDTSPFAELRSTSLEGSEETTIMHTVSSFLERKPFKVDYSRPYSEVCKDFISFCITEQSDPTRALDILCRPWAPPGSLPTDAKVTHKKLVPYKFQKERTKLWLSTGQPRFRKSQRTEYDEAKLKEISGPSNIRNNSVMEDKGLSPPTQGYELADHDKVTFSESIAPPDRRQGISTLGDLAPGVEEQASSDEPGIATTVMKEHAAAKETVKPIRDDRTTSQYFKDIEDDSETQKGLDLVKALVKKYGKIAKDPRKKREDSISDRDSDDSEAEEQSEESEEEDMALPSWISSNSGAPYGLFPHPGNQKVLRMGRRNADPLVGLPQDGHKNYNAAQNKRVDLTKEKRLRFRRRTGCGNGHYSLYTRGFVLDEVKTVTEPARNGSIPETWPQLAGWKDAVDGDTEPPPEFWRTLVADRGKDNRNPPYYYATACKESVKKGGLRGGSVNTSALITNERNSIVAEFCRRVQSVIWNRSLIKTKSGTLGLASQHVRQGDYVCILFGCTVPVILRKCSSPKDSKETQQEEAQDNFESFKACLSRCEDACFRKMRYRNKLAKLEQQNPEEKELWTQEVKEEMEVVNDQIKPWKEKEEKAREEKNKEEEEKRERKKKADERRSRRQQGRKRREEVDTNRAARSRLDKSRNRSETMPLQSTSRRNSTGSAAGSGAGRGIPEGEKRKEEMIENLEARHNQTKEEESQWYYTFMGGAYIHGMMDGEAVRQHIVEGTDEQYFEIR